jgi:hypothetical protein
MMIYSYKSVALAIFVLLTGCGSLPPEEGVPMDSVFNSGFSGLDSKSAFDLLKQGMENDYSNLAGAPVLPMVRPMALMPIFIPEKKASKTNLIGGHWIYESVDDGGIVER